MGLWERAPLRLRRYLVYRREGPWPPLPPPAGVVLEPVDRELLPLLPEAVDGFHRGRPRPLRSLFADYLLWGHRGVVVRVEGAYAGHLWLRPPGTPPLPHLPWGFLPEPLFWAYDAFVLPPFRGRGLIRLALAGLCQGLEEVYAEVHPGNRAAQRSLEAMGFRPTGLLHVLILGVPRVRWWRWARFRPL